MHVAAGVLWDASSFGYVSLWLGSFQTFASCLIVSGVGLVSFFQLFSVTANHFRKSKNVQDKSFPQTIEPAVWLLVFVIWQFKHQTLRCNVKLPTLTFEC